jgi:hypothetical protein
MQERCDALFREILSDKQRRALVLTDPRAVHRALFEGLTPEGYRNKTAARKAGLA